MTTLYREAAQLRDLLKSKKRWTQEVLARDKNGRPVCHDGLTACKFCLIGGIMRVSDMPSSSPWGAAGRTDLGQLMLAIIRQFDEKYLDSKRNSYEILYDFNDEVSHKDVLEVLNTAVAFAKGAGV